MYGLCEIHKDTTVNDPLSLFQPILSAIGTTLVVLGLQVVLTTLENLLHQYLKQFTINEFTVKDSFSFCEEILDQNPNLFMASFDIQSLFTNIPLDETIDIQVDLVFRKKKKEVEGMLKRHFKQVLSVKSSCFLFNDNCYKKVEGVAMGSPLGPTNYS